LPKTGDAGRAVVFGEVGPSSRWGWEAETAALKRRASTVVQAFAARAFSVRRHPECLQACVYCVAYLGSGSCPQCFGGPEKTLDLVMHSDAAFF